jgi:hypothetical protein
MCLIVFIQHIMEFTINDSQYNTNLQTRRLRLISDLIEDYQENMSRAMGLIEFEMGVSNASNTQDRRTSRGLDDWLENILPTNEVPRYSSRGRRTQNSLFDNISVSENTNTTNIANPNIRRGFIYTQLIDPPTTSTDGRGGGGISVQQIESATELIQYDVSMNETRCPITLDTFEPGQNILRVNSCGHIFGQHALLEWCHRHSKCPVCRTSLVSASVDASNASADVSASMDASRGSGRTSRTRTNTTTSSSSDVINQLMSGIINGVNNSLNTDSGYYESSMTFGVNELIDAYRQLTQTPSTVSTSRTSSTSEQPQL